MDCLILILDDTQRDIPIAIKDDVDDAIVQALNNSLPVKLRRRQYGDRITLSPPPHSTCWSRVAKIKEQLTSTILAQQVKDNMNRFVFPAIEYLIKEKEALSQQMMSQQASSYRLNKLITLGSVHYPTNSVADYQFFIDELVLNFCTAAEHCTYTSHLGLFFRKCRQMGNCNNVFVRSRTR